MSSRRAAWLASGMLVLGCGRVAFDPLEDDGGDAGPSDVRIKNVQTFTHDSSSGTEVTLVSAVDPSKTFVLCDVRTTDSAAGTAPTCELSGPSTLRVTVGVPAPTTIVGVQVVEMTGNVRVQRGTDSFTVADQAARMVSVPTAVEPQRTFLILQRRTNYMFNDADHVYEVSGHLLDPTSLRLSREGIGNTNNTLDVHWQLVEVEGLSAQARTAAVSVNALTEIVTLATPVEPGVSFVIASGQRGGDEFEADRLLRVEHMTAAQVVATRNQTIGFGSFVGFTVVAFPGLRVQFGTTAMVDQLAITVPIAPVDPTRSFATATLSGGLAGFDNHLDSALTTASVNASGHLVLERGENMAIDARVTWFVVEWPQ